MFKFKPSNNISVLVFNSILAITCWVLLSLFWYFDVFRAYIEWLEEPKIKSILLHPSTQSAAATVDSIPAVIPIL